jgi:hypothetical protein
MRTARTVGKPHVGGRDAGLLIAASRETVSKPHIAGPDAGLLIAGGTGAVGKPHVGCKNAGLSKTRPVLHGKRPPVSENAGMSKAGRSGFFDNPAFWDKIFRQPRISGRAGRIRLRQPRNLGQAGRGNVHGRTRFRQPRISGREVEVQPGGRTPALAARAVSKPHMAGRNAGLLIAASRETVSKPHTAGPDAGLLIAASRETVSKPHVGCKNAGLLIAVAARSRFARSFACETLVARWFAFVSLPGTAIAQIARETEARDMRPCVTRHMGKDDDLVLGFIALMAVVAGAAIALTAIIVKRRSRNV